MSVLDFLVKQEKPLLEISMKGQQVCQSHSVDVRSMTIYSSIYDVPVIVINMTFKPIKTLDRGNSLSKLEEKEPHRCGLPMQTQVHTKFETSVQ